MDNFSRRSPHEDILDVVAELPKGFQDIAFGKRFAVSAGSGGFSSSEGALAEPLRSCRRRDERVTKVVANCPVVNWADSRSLRKSRDIQTWLRWIHSRSVWERLSLKRRKLAEPARRDILQSVASQDGNRWHENNDLSRERRSSRALR